ncbi:Exodeoxyribonuclease 7 large subunit [Botrimarina colliarenosi]|uniref:Exodeoxyribonuclease 7 large subunit n=1 Tax=Botrimarina colliarenosi TaxID=2528001 RepID=A0A5C6AK21_9BACT|nr:exodeoxyribonuclease VII large subunit [Botrimarina colliarenosi]TWT99766.1 Exodeoxyribonuclease 7 large subunit [Botrimarina colliarenosi]
MTRPNASHEPLSVAALTVGIKETLESGFPDVWVAGEVSNFSRPSSGHCYFTLKDDAAQIRAVMWRGSAARLRFDLHDGLELVCHGSVDVYAPRGSYQLVVNEAQPRGVGALELQLQKLREKLAAEGLFDRARKRPLPAFPRRIAFVTSPTGAAIRDFLQVLSRRWRGVDVLVIPARVQGEGAAVEIAAGIRAANRLRPALDALVVGRGGGSLEDLWCFNEEAVVRAIAASEIPVISAVGHEIDVTLSDLVADVRALTPSEAAERVAPSGDEITQRLQTLSGRLHGAARRRVALGHERVARAARSRPFARPHAMLQDTARRLDDLDRAANRAVGRQVERGRARLGAIAGKLDSLSPLGVLHRGYSLTTDQQGKLVRSASEVSVGDRLTTRLARGEVVSIVDDVTDTA